MLSKCECSRRRIVWPFWLTEFALWLRGGDTLGLGIFSGAGDRAAGIEGQGARPIPWHSGLQYTQGPVGGSVCLGGAKLTQALSSLLGDPWAELGWQHSYD